MNKITRMGSDQAQYAESITIPSNASLIYVSGILPNIYDNNAEPGSTDSYGNTKIQAHSVLTKIQNILTKQNLEMKDIIQMRVFLVGTPELNGKLDFKGFQEAYIEFFPEHNVQTKPTRTAVQVVSLPLPGTLVEIDIIASKVIDAI